MRILIMLAAAGCAGCGAAAPAGPVEPPVPGRVVLFRGSGEIFSGGLDRIAGELHQRGISAKVEWSLGDAALGKADRPLVLGGHSVGADTAVRKARELGQQNVRVDLLVLIDPFDPEPIPGNVRHLLLVSGRPFGLKVHENVGISQYRIPDQIPVLDQIRHLVITDDEAARFVVMRRILAVFGKKAPAWQEGGEETKAEKSAAAVRRSPGM